MWVVRPRAHNELGACLAAGVVGLGTQSGIDVDATGLSPAELRALSKELSGTPAGEGPAPAVDVPRRDARPATGSALPIEHGAGLLLGEVVGDYLFQGRELLPHRRPARWDRVVPRSAALPAGDAAGPAGAVPVVLDPAVARLASVARAAARSAAAPGRGRRACRRRRGSASTCQSCWVRPCWIGSATTSIRPAVIGRTKSVLLLTPTANWPRSTHRGARPDAGRRLDDRAVDAAVHDAPRRVLVGAELDVPGHPGAGRPR